MAKTPKKIGRPSLLTDDRIDTIAQGVEDGLPISRAAEAAGVHRATVSVWLDRGRAEAERLADAAEAEPDKQHPVLADERPFLTLLNEVERAKRSLEKALLANVKAQASETTGFQAAKWLLGIIDRETYGDAPKRTEISGPNGGPLEVDVSSLVALATAVTGGYDEADEADA